MTAGSTHTPFPPTATGSLGGRSVHAGVVDRTRTAVRDFAATLTATDALLLASVLLVTWTKLYWEPLGKLMLDQLLATAFVVAVVARRVRDRDLRVAPETAMALAFVLAFAAVECLGYIGIDTAAGRTQFLKGFVAWGIRAVWMLAAVDHLTRHRPGGTRRMYVRFAMAFVAGAALDGLYGIGQLVVWGAAHRNLDDMVLTPLRFTVGGTRGIQEFAPGIYRLNGLMRDTNHLGVMLASPLAIAVVWMRGRWRLAAVGVMAIALVLTLSRSGAVAAIGALAVLAVAERRRIRISWVVAGVLLLAGAVVAFAHFEPVTWQTIVLSRFDPNTRGSQTHIALYGLVPHLLSMHPLAGVGMNGFALQLQEVSGRTEFGPHSMYIQLLVETGLLGFAVYLAFAAWMLDLLARVGTRWAWAIAAALVGTWAGNAFYLTTQVMYVDLLYVLAIAAPAVARGSRGADSAVLHDTGMAAAGAHAAPPE